MAEPPEVRRQERPVRLHRGRRRGYRLCGLGRQRQPSHARRPTGPPARRRLHPDRRGHRPATHRLGFGRLPVHALQGGKARAGTPRHPNQERRGQGAPHHPSHGARSRPDQHICRRHGAVSSSRRGHGDGRDVRRADRDHNRSTSCWIAAAAPSTRSAAPPRTHPASSISPGAIRGHPGSPWSARA